jgi:hypothetical protein
MLALYLGATNLLRGCPASKPTASSRTRRRMRRSSVHRARRNRLGTGAEWQAHSERGRRNRVDRNTRAEVRIHLLPVELASTTIDSRFQAGSESAYDMPLAGAGQRSPVPVKIVGENGVKASIPGTRFVELRRWPGVWGVEKDPSAPEVFNRWLHWSFIWQAWTAVGRFSVPGPSEVPDDSELRRPFGPATCSSIALAEC